MSNLFVVGNLELEMGKLSYKKELIDVDCCAIAVNLWDYKLLIEEVVMEAVGNNAYITNNPGHYKIIFHGQLTLPTIIEPRPAFIVSQLLTHKFIEESLENRLFEECK